MRSRKSLASKTSSLLLQLASHAAMGVAVGLAFAFLVLHISQFGIATLISYSPDPAAVQLRFAGVCVICFGIGATLTGLLIIFTEEEP